MTAPIFDIQAKFETALNATMDLTERFPRRLRYSLATRIDDALLRCLEALLAARFATGPVKHDALNLADAALLRLRTLWRVAYQRKAIGIDAYERLSVAYDEVGRMLGGLKAHQVG